MKTETDTEKQEAISTLKDLFKRSGYKAYTVLRHVSDSGMKRVISVYVIADNTPVCIDWYIEKLGLYKRTGVNDRHEGLVAHGCGMDMGFDIVYNTSRAVFKDAFYCHGKGDKNGVGRCRSNDHSNGSNDYSKKRLHSDAGYAVKQEWM